jgi:hypothetical protein
MRLDRFTSIDKRGRFSVIDNRTRRVVHNGDPEDDFFVIKLKDRFAAPALLAYAAAAEASGDDELAADVRLLVRMADQHPRRKRPD